MSYPSFGKKLPTKGQENSLQGNLFTALLTEYHTTSHPAFTSIA
jgi:hypothetical protein